MIFDASGLLYLSKQPKFKLFPTKIAKTHSTCQNSGGGAGSVHGSEMGGGGGCYTGGPGSITGSSLYDLDSAHPSGKKTSGTLILKRLKTTIL